jgi:hypothetical protein
MNPRDILIGSIDVDLVDDEVISRILENVSEMKRVTDGSIEPAAPLEIRHPKMDMINHAT